MHMFASSVVRPKALVKIKLRIVMLKPRLDSLLMGGYFFRI